MKKILFSLLVLTGLVFANCYDFVSLAEDRLAPPYPSYFGAAGEYMHAGDCFYNQGNIKQANFYYEKSAEYYIDAADSLLPGADNFLRASSYEKAAEAYKKEGLKSKAIQLYEKSKATYERYGFNEEGARITGLIVALNTSNSIDFINIIGIISLVSLILSLLVLSYLFTQNEELKEIISQLKPEKKVIKKEQPIVRRKASDFASSYVPEKPKQKFKEIKINVKEKYAKKLREKYMPKH